MIQVEPKTANQRWRESGTTLSFAKYMEREKLKMASFTSDEQEIMVNKPLNDAIQDSLAMVNSAAGNKTSVSSNKIFGINKYVLYGAGIIVVAAIIYKISTHKNKKS
jgi:hypothetical protein